MTVTVIPTPSVPPASSGSGAPSSASPRVQPVLPAQAAGSAAGQGASGATTAGQTAAPAQQVSAQALLTLLQTLGKPLNGSVASAQSSPGQGASGGLPVQLTLPSSTTGTRAAQLAATLPMPDGAASPPSGTPIRVEADGTGRIANLTVTVTGSPAATGESLRADAARQGSLAPLFADLARLGGQSSSTSNAQQPIAQAIERLLGFALDGDATIGGNALRTALETAMMGSAQRQGASSGGATNAAGNASASASANGVQSALGALIRALGLSSSATPGTGTSAQGTPPAPAGLQQSGPLPLPSANAPSKAPSAGLPSSMPDLTDPAALAQLKAKAETALSRLNLLQAGDGSVQTRAAENQPAPVSVRWDIPLFTGQEAALLGVAIDQDAHHASQRTQESRNWRFRFGFESKALGGIDGVVALRQVGIAGAHEAPAHDAHVDAHVDVGVWADDEAVLARLQAQREPLVEQLRALGLIVDSLTIASADAHPDKASPPDHHHVDLSS